MTTVIQVKGIKKTFGEREILKDIHFEIRQGEKIGLVGWNGSGKTTLVNILAGHIEQDQGSITTWPSHLKMGYLPQSTDCPITMDNIMVEAKEDFFHMTKRMGLSKDLLQSEQSPYLSGGERLKLSLANIWANHPEFIILDEPTNHLDLHGVQWLIDEVKSFAGAAIVISHDRYFLDETVTKIFEIENGELTIYEGNYTAYRLEKQRRYDQQLRDYNKQQRKVDMIHQQVNTLKNWSDKAHKQAGKGGSNSENRQMGVREFERAKAKKKDNQVKSKLKRLNLELSKYGIEKPKEEASVLFQFENAGKRGKRVLEAQGLTKQFGDRLLFEESHFYIKHGERIGVIGSNGTGKTTLIKMLLGEESITKGSFWKSESIKLAYLSQDVLDLPENKSIKECFDLSNREQSSKARSILVSMGIDDSKWTKPISHLSLGERTRVKLAEMILQEYDLLILDEPTNHLDLPSREQLEETLLQFAGTLLIVSHDRYFVEKCCDKLLSIQHKKISRIEMGLSEFLSREQQKTIKPKQNIQEELAILDHKITELLGRISMYKPGTEEYVTLDQDLNAYMDQKRRLMK
ncbi:ABC-F type ribosomal protection protein [Fictibacillus nanhaiensis]|uniref:ribosomal protection-like ABC-F family protein n=1 Tax=Fictibacillus nanhaiensis TaxID=742169 RepID=UPI001C950E97|nr:ABC-F type ribosomal protection protein [Fictibacillus nanhaiensis]MBY6037604.1 ABC-F type ribosomal protection protein [Fictibacillus nanhaiensis]